MAIENHIEILKSGKDNWNKWLNTNWEKMDGPTIPLKEGLGKLVPYTRADLRGVKLGDFGDLKGYDFYRVDFRGSNFDGVKFEENRFRRADLSNCSIKGTEFNHCEMDGSKFLFSELHKSRFDKCTLAGANFGSLSSFQSQFHKCDLSNSILTWARFIETDFSYSKLSFARIYGISIWDCTFNDIDQNDLIISKRSEPTISVDNLEIGQFIYLLLSNKKIRNILDALTSKVVLILGRFTEERMKVLKDVQSILRIKNYIPVLFDFEKPESRDLTETISTLANLSRFIIADLTDAKSIPQELSHIIPFLPSVTVQPIIMKGQMEYSMFEHFMRYPWVNSIMEYDSSVSEEFLAKLITNVNGKSI